MIEKLKWDHHGQNKKPINWPKEISFEKMNNYVRF